MFASNSDTALARMYLQRRYAGTPAVQSTDALLRNMLPSNIPERSMQGYIAVQNQLRHRDMEAAHVATASRVSMEQQLASLCNHVNVVPSRDDSQRAYHFAPNFVQLAPPNGVSPNLTQFLAQQTQARYHNVPSVMPNSVHHRSYLQAQLVNRVLQGSGPHASAMVPKPASGPAVPVPVAARPGAPSETNRAEIFVCLPVSLAQPHDVEKLSSLQALLRFQIEAFAATDDHLTTHTRGRTKRIRLGQVGIRCRHCASLPLILHAKGSTYFPTTVQGFYQAAQNMGAVHVFHGACSAMPGSLKTTFASLLEHKSSASGAGRSYWTKTARQLGLVDTDHGIYAAHQVPADACIVENAAYKPAHGKMLQTKRVGYMAETEACNKRVRL